ncbi:MAG TPA: hypothetical protein VGP06_19265, partial [Janthinobacterium sp.]|nr:hypothetical protein [Janthinobacterium sp.]
MGRLFWKFFLSILLAQLAAIVGIGGAYWLREPAHAQQRSPDIDTSPPAQLYVDAAAATLEYGGAQALRSLLSDMERHRVLAVDETGRDLLGHKVNPLMLAEARETLARAERNRDQAILEWHDALAAHRDALDVAVYAAVGA